MCVADICAHVFHYMHVFFLYSVSWHCFVPRIPIGSKIMYQNGRVLFESLMNGSQRIMGLTEGVGRTAKLQSSYTLPLPGVQNHSENK